MSQHALPHRVFPFDPYAIPDDFVVSTSSTMLQNERASMLRYLQRSGVTEEVMMQSLQEDTLEQIRDHMEALDSEWLKNEGIQENLSDFKLDYMDDMTGGFSWTMEGTATAHRANSRQFCIDFTNNWYNEIHILVGGVLILSIDLRDA